MEIKSCDILLFESNYRGWFGWWGWIVSKVTRSKWTHVALILKNPTYVDATYKGLYVLESGSEPWNNNWGVMVSPLDKVLEDPSHKCVAVRKLLDVEVPNEKHEYILITQWDTFIFRRIPDYMMRYSYIGAPWNHSYIKRGDSKILSCGEGCKCGNCNKVELIDGDVVIKVGNGGFSLRRVKDHMDVCDLYKRGNEDVFFSLTLQDIAPMNIANEFSVEHIAYDGIPIGCHQIWHFQSDEYVKNLLTKYLNKP